MGSVQRKIALLGSGNFAWQLYEFFRSGDVPLAFHYARSTDGFSDFIPRDSTLQCTELDPLMEAEVIILAISDQRSLSFPVGTDANISFTLPGLSRWRYCRAIGTECSTFLRP